MNSAQVMVSVRVLTALVTKSREAYRGDAISGTQIPTEKIQGSCAKRIPTVKEIVIALVTMSRGAYRRDATHGTQILIDGT